MWDYVLIGALIGIGIYAIAYLVANEVESRLKDRLDAIEDKLDTIEYALSPRQDPFEGID
jgi:uncharacterized membrane-anchored protein YhcB (DUF1043 family)